MSSYLSVDYILSALKGTYRCIEIRNLSINLGEDVCNLATVIRLSGVTAGAAAKAITKHKNAQEPFGDERLQFNYRTSDISFWNDIEHEFKNGELKFGNRKVRLMRSVSLLDMRGYIESSSFTDRPADWPQYEASNQWTPVADKLKETQLAQKLRIIPHDEDLRRRLNAHGYQSLKEVCHVFLGSRLDVEPSYASDVYLSAVVFASIREFSYNPEAKKLLVSYDCHPSLNDRVRIFGEVAGTIGTRSRPIKFTLAPAKTRRKKSTSVVSAPVELSNDMAGINVRLTHDTLGQVHSRGVTPRELIPPADINPLWPILRRFCTTEKFRELLISPPQAKDDRPKEQRWFEQHVGWLLSLHGFSSIVLGPFENLRRVGSPVHLGSLDLIAFHPGHKLLLFGSCTINPPEERDYGNLVNIRAVLLAELPENRSFSTHQAIFTSAHRCVTPDHYTGENFVAVFDAGDLSRAVDCLDRENDLFFDKLRGRTDGLHFGVLNTF
jgi:hypothetical protein